ncbi:2-oxoacid:acceptor oxidoreductase subunit alpha [Egicoccus halophilus]|uniref:2-oxoglutarate ferredoxin oxidoreductase subunit alpha n=1 Tax=Egicoccus halophilus TaxID=1670830 RepID=A0A8J3AGD4_9ACTN|nr:2-oxoacid:acceptor oxidoreductase subunit alpha [Egicoccus halophilus]GGI08274.1 2-oxoglutarate ferredoxin oxidoreductase subunit alpha [Egicoccus halophilus]
MTETAARHRVQLSNAVIRFAGDSGDGMQLTGDRFTTQSALAGNDLATLPDFPAEIRAPAGTLAGVSSFQLHFSDKDIHTPGDRPDVLVAMNPAALLKHLEALKPGGTLIVNADAFEKRNLAKAGYDTNPLEDGSVTDYQVHEVALTDLTLRALQGQVEAGELNKKEAERCKNMFALGLVSWMFHRPLDDTETWLTTKFAKRPELARANVAALHAGRNYGETTEAFTFTYEVKAAKLTPGRYRNITGNQALAYGLVAASVRSGLPLFYGSYPITPASDILHELSRQKHFGVSTFQAEDEIAAIGSVIGAAFGGALAVTASSGPGIALKSEAMGLALATELPLVVVDVQRGGPSTGLPTKTEQSDLLQVLYGRNGEAPMPVVAATSPADCFDAAIEACRIALTYRTPVVLLSDGYLANSAEPWRLPEVDDLPDLRVEFTTEPNGEDGTFLPYLRDPDTLARPWAVPGTPGLQHRIGGLEKEDVTGHISYEADNHQRMTDLRAAKVAKVADALPPTPVEDPDGAARVLVVGWGSTDGPLRAACHELRGRGRAVARIHLRHLAPLPRDLDELLRRYDRVVCAENNSGQLAMLLRARTLVDVQPYTRVTGQPFSSAELMEAITTLGFGTGQAATTATTDNGEVGR